MQSPDGAGNVAAALRGYRMLTLGGSRKAMANSSLATNDVLAAVAGHDPQLVGELRAALLGGAMLYADLLKRARCDANWVAAARRLSSLAASFSAAELQVAAEEALVAAPGDPVALRRVTRAILNLGA